MGIIADDLTGAADAAAAFASAGLPTFIPFHSGPMPRAAIVALSTESRDADVQAATHANHLAARSIGGHGSTRSVRWIYKKIDSTMRGYPGAELLAILDVAGEKRALVAPALPAEGRTTRAGYQYISGVRLEKACLAESGAQSDLAAVFGQRQDVPIHLLPLNIIRKGAEAVREFVSKEVKGIVIADAESDADLLALAHGVARSELRILCGSAGFARALASALPFIQKEVAQPVAALGVAPVLVVAGSQHPATIRQVAMLERADFAVVRPDPSVFTGSASQCARIAARVAAPLKDGRSVVLTTTHLPPIPSGESIVVRRLGEITASPDVYRHVGGLALTGGHVAAGVLAELKPRALRLWGEIRPAMPWGMLDSELTPNLPVATKAGGFGADDALLACLHHLQGGSI
jgi:uncharacterized protein YgbK (DUF1537 family)